MLSLYGRNKEMVDWNISSPDFSFELASNHKFPKDKLLFENDLVVVGFDGVVLNKKKILGNSTWQNYFLEDLENLAPKLNNLRGSFNGFIYEKKAQRLRLFNDPCGFQKDEEENYQSFTTLSGGLDSRVTALYGYELGYKNQVTFTCSQQGYDDEIIARKIAQDYGFEHHFYPMDGSKKEELPPALSANRVSPDLLPIDKEWEATQQKKYHHEGHYKMTERGFNSIAAGVWGLEHLSYNIAPFTHTDFIDFSLTIPYDLIYKRKVYLEWLNRYHPKWTRYRWEHLHARPTRLWMAQHDLLYLRLRFGWRKLLSKKFRQTFDMAPEQYWFEQQPDLKIFLEATTFPLLEAIRPLDIPYFEVIEKMARSKNVQLRVRALSLLEILEVLRY